MATHLLQQYEQIARVYLREALYRLSMAEGTVRLDFVPSLASNDLADWLVSYSPEDQTIYVSKSGLASLIPEHKVNGIEVRYILQGSYVTYQFCRIVHKMGK